MIINKKTLAVSRYLLKFLSHIEDSICWEEQVIRDDITGLSATAIELNISVNQLISTSLSLSVPHLSMFCPIYSCFFRPKSNIRYICDYMHNNLYEHKHIHLFFHAGCSFWQNPIFLFWYRDLSYFVIMWRFDQRRSVAASFKLISNWPQRVPIFNDHFSRISSSCPGFVT